MITDFVNPRLQPGAKANATGLHDFIRHNREAVLDKLSPSQMMAEMGAPRKPISPNGFIVGTFPSRGWRPTDRVIGHPVPMPMRPHRPS